MPNVSGVKTVNGRFIIDTNPDTHAHKNENKTEIKKKKMKRTLDYLRHKITKR